MKAACTSNIRDPLRDEAFTNGVSLQHQKSNPSHVVSGAPPYIQLPVGKQGIFQCTVSRFFPNVNTGTLIPHRRQNVVPVPNSVSIVTIAHIVESPSESAPFSPVIFDCVRSASSSSPSRAKDNLVAAIKQIYVDYAVTITSCFIVIISQANNTKVTVITYIRPATRLFFCERLTQN